MEPRIIPIKSHNELPPLYYDYGDKTLVAAQASHAAKGRGKVETVYQWRGHYCVAMPLPVKEGG